MRTPTDFPQNDTLPILSLLIPFDSGQTFIFRSKRTNHKEVEDEWKSVFSGHPHGESWTLDQWEGFQKPMGWTATWHYHIDPKPHLEQAVKTLSESIPGQLDGPNAIRAVMFPNGIGVMIIRVRAKNHCRPGEWEAEFREQPDTVRLSRFDAYRILIKWVGACYIEFMNSASRRHERGSQSIVAVHAIERKHSTMEVKHTYPLFFYGKNDCSEWFNALEPDSTRKYYKTEMSIRWGTCVVQREEIDHTAEIERNFVIGLASWFALLTMTNRSTEYIRDALHSMSCGKRAEGSGNAQVIRLAYTEAANQAFPIQWTSKEEDLLLLEAIHRCWISDRWWKIVEQKTTLLAAHWEQQADASSEHWNRRLTAFGATIACLTLASTVADVIGLIVQPPVGTSNGVEGFSQFLISARIWLGLVAPLLLGGVIALYFLLPLRHRDSRSGQ